MTNADPERLADEILDELRTSDSRPRALFAFFSTTHVPFAAPWPYYHRGDPRYGGPHRYAYDVQRLADVTRKDHERLSLHAGFAQHVQQLGDGLGPL
jgi:hypothetical protein